MQFKRPINVAKTRKTGIPTWVNSFQFLRANKLVLSVKLGELVNGWEIPADVMARCKGEPLTPQELADWKAWKVKHDREERQDTDQAVYRVAGENVADTLRNACHALDRGIVLNGLAVLDRSPQPTLLAGLPPVDEYYRDEVIGGPGAFLMVAEGYESFAGAVRRKIIREIAAIPAPGPVVEREYA